MLGAHAWISAEGFYLADVAVQAAAPPYAPPAPPCTGGTMPSSFPFCVTCPASLDDEPDTETPWSSLACSEGAAQSAVQQLNTNCQVESGGCSGD